MTVLRLLLLEDSPLDAELILAALADGGFVVEAERVDTPEDFRSRLPDCAYDIVLADYSLPRFRDLEALTMAQEACPERPFIYISGRLGEELAVETLKAGATDYVLKHRLESLVPAVRRALRETAERAERRRAEAALAEVRESLAEQLADMTRLHEMTTRLSQTLELGSLLEEVLATVTALHGSDWGLLLLPERQGGRLKVAASRGLRDEYLKALEPTLDQTTCGVAFARRQRVVIEDVEADGDFSSFRDLARREGLRASHSVPLLTRKREAVGALSVYFREPHRPSPRELRLVDLYAHQAAEAIDNARLYRAVQDAGRRKDEFLAMLGHELRNPLAPIRNALQILGLRGDETATRDWARGVMERQVQHMTRLVDDLLDMSRITTGKVLLKRELCDLTAVVRAAVEDHRAALEAAGLKLECAVPADPVWVSGDATRLAQVVDNLLTNAAKFTDAGGRVATRLVVEPERRRAVVTVRDSGIGIDPDLVPRLFDTFMQADRTLDRSRGGLGLGLALVRGLIELHGGGVRAESGGPGKGSAFSFWLPLQDAPSRPVKERSGEFAVGRPRRILLIEDNRDTALSFKMLLELVGHEVAVAHTGREGVAAAQRHRPEVVLCDLGLPEMDGHAVARALRHDAATAEAWLIAVSGYGQEEDRKRSQEAGFDRHLTKPVEPKQVLELLATLPPRRGEP